MGDAYAKVREAFALKTIDCFLRKLLPIEKLVLWIFIVHCVSATCVSAVSGYAASINLGLSRNGTASISHASQAYGKLQELELIQKLQRSLLCSSSSS